MEHDPAREIVSSRVIDVPRERVFKAFTDPACLAKWWGPSGFTNTFETCDIRPGGAWRFVMHGPDGKYYPNESVFREVVAPERIVIEHLSTPRFTLTATLAEEAGKTRLTWRGLFESAAVCAAVRVFAVPANEQNFDRLQAELAKMA